MDCSHKQHVFSASVEVRTADKAIPSSPLKFWRSHCYLREQNSVPASGDMGLVLVVESNLIISLH